MRARTSGVLANAAAEYDGIGPAQGREIGTQVLAGPVAEDGHG
jgi:hypothetical protein